MSFSSVCFCAAGFLELSFFCGRGIADFATESPLAFISGAFAGFFLEAGSKAPNDEFSLKTGAKKYKKSTNQTGIQKAHFKITLKLIES